MVDQIKVPTAEQIENLSNVDEVVSKVLGLRELYPNLTEIDLLRLMAVHHAAIIQILRQDVKSIVDNIQADKDQNYQPARFTGFGKNLTF